MFTVLFGGFNIADPIWRSDLSGDTSAMCGGNICEETQTFVSIGNGQFDLNCNRSNETLKEGVLSVSPLCKRLILEPDFLECKMHDLQLLKQFLHGPRELCRLKNGRAHQVRSVQKLYQRTKLRTFLHIDQSFKAVWVVSDTIFVNVSTVEIDLLGQILRVTASSPSKSVLEGHC